MLDLLRGSPQPSTVSYCLIILQSHGPSQPYPPMLVCPKKGYPNAMAYHHVLRKNKNNKLGTPRRHAPFLMKKH